MTVTPERLQLAERAQALRAEGAPYDRIAATLGISCSYASALVTDPAGEQARERKLRYGGTCEDCGARTWGGGGRAKAPRRCVACSQRRQQEQRRWTPDAIVDAIHRFAAEHGRQPTSTEWQSDIRGDGYPATETVLDVFGSWAAGVEAAGFERPRRGSRIVVKTLCCETCGQEFTSYVRTARYCSNRCGRRAWRKLRRKLPEWEPHPRPCANCGETFMVTRPNGLYCSIACGRRAAQARQRERLATA
jgi:hypothetical protein